MTNEKVSYGVEYLRKKPYKIVCIDKGEGKYTVCVEKKSGFYKNHAEMEETYRREKPNANIV